MTEIQLDFMSYIESDSRRMRSDNRVSMVFMETLH